MLSASRLLGRCAARARGVAPRRMCSTGGGAPPSVGEAPLPPIRNALDKLPKSVLKNNLDPLDLQKANSFLGFSLRSTHPASYRNLLGHVGGQTMIDPEETLFAMRRALALLKKVSFRGGRTLFISTTPMLARLTRVVGQQSGQFYLAKRWVPGLLTNWDKGRAHIRKKLTLDPRLMAAGKLRNSDLMKANAFRGVEQMTKPPDLIFLLDATQLHGEPDKLNIPVIGVVDTDNNQAGVDYPIPANTKSLRFYHTLAHMLVRSVKDGHSLRDDLDTYLLPGERGAKDEARGQHSQHRGGRRGGRDNRSRPKLE